ncbi:Nascent polypeptide-associated complex subunit beta [Physocladia obscura]|uniref:Nascent polypeptide-associated complex subunit beta n=1 Tax=Physocladia obscura TaxID=109957 RepID=A0AAD5SXM9_9FUNG|nr:Nascent polypeptide-associated complex subunit beta [Physocladia obscura]
MNTEKLAKLQAQAASLRIGGKGTPRRKVNKVVKTPGADDKKLQATLQKLEVQDINGVEEVNFFKSDGTVVHFSAPLVEASLPNNTVVVTGYPQKKDLTELVPGILTQLGADSLNQLRQLAAAYQQQAAVASGSSSSAVGAAAVADDDDDVPELVENFE